MKVLHLALMATFSVVYATVAVAVPITYYGQKGEYTVDYEAGTYRGCVYGTGCIKLGAIARPAFRPGKMEIILTQLMTTQWRFT
ncbi:hypothetical protein NON20_01685 [Synechocystis sp. B12]|nr:hypothetical protein NON20_01685 [Synechocystis sp. B12]